MGRDPEQKQDHARHSLNYTPGIGQIPFWNVFLQSMMYSDIPSAQTLALYCKSWGVKNIVISPGSRNAPLILGFTKNPYFQCFSIVDERAAGFFALGMSKQSKKPVALVCTSGSALLNYYPAVAEAYYSDVPLVVMSADRPDYKIDVGDGQTIRQENVFANHIAYSANLKQDLNHATDAIRQFKSQLLQGSQNEVQAYNEEQIRAALGRAITEKAPVHLNIPFEEPLYGLLAHPNNLAPPIEIPSNAGKELVEFEKYRFIWETANRKMVLAGMNGPNSLGNGAMEKLAEDKTVLVFTETTSNLHHPNFFPSIDSIVAPIEKAGNRDELFEALRPDLLVTFGGIIVSKKIKAFLRHHRPKNHWHVDCRKAYDTFFCLTEHIKTSPDVFFGNMPMPKERAIGYRSKWAKVKHGYETKRKQYLQSIAFSDFLVFNMVQKAIPKYYQVHLSNSSTIRYSQLFPMDRSLQVFSNRGTSGIDGSTSTAVGASVHHESPTVLITGDLSFFYDGNGLWNNYLRPDFRIILINNSGGGIFRILPGTEESDDFSTYFETSHKLKAEHLANMHGLEYLTASNGEDLENCLGHFYSSSNAPKILEICTPRSLNSKVLLNYFDFISLKSTELKQFSTNTNTASMSKRDELTAKYAADIKDKFGETPDMDLLNKVVIGLGPAIYNLDASKVSGSDDKELETVKNNFLIKKLGLSDSSDLMDAIDSVIDKYGKSDKNKYRAVIYYMLTKHFGKESIYD